jgi:hypothetical protein
MRSLPAICGSLSPLDAVLFGDTWRRSLLAQWNLPVVAF